MNEAAADELHLLRDNLSGNFTKEELVKKRRKLNLKHTVLKTEPSSIDTDLNVGGDEKGNPKKNE